MYVCVCVLGEGLIIAPQAIHWYVHDKPNHHETMCIFSDKIHLPWIYNIRRTKSQNLNDSRIVLQLSLPNPFKLGVKSNMEMWLGQRCRRGSNYIWVISKFISN